MALRFWVLGTGTWDGSTTTHWAATSGGSGGQSVPTSSDDVTFDASSGGGTCTISGTQNSLSLTLTNSNTNVVGNVATRGNVALSATAAINRSLHCDIINTCNWTSNGGVHLSVSLQANLTVQDSYTESGFGGVGGLGITAGTFSANNKTITTTGFNTSGSTTRALSMGSGTWHVIGTGAGSETVWSVAGTGFTLTPSTSTISIETAAGNTATFAGGGQTYANLTYAGTTGTNGGGLIVTGANTFVTFKDHCAVTHTITLPASTTTTATTFDLVGAGGTHLISLISSSSGTAATISQASGTVSGYYLSIKDSTATGGATFNAYYSTNVSGNTGWNFKQSTSGMFSVF